MYEAAEEQVRERSDGALPSAVPGGERVRAGLDTRASVSAVTRPIQIQE